MRQDKGTEGVSFSGDVVTVAALNVDTGVVVPVENGGLSWVSVDTSHSDDSAVSGSGASAGKALEYHELLGGACSDCVQAIAYDDYTGMEYYAEVAVRAGLERIGEWLIVGDELGFSSRSCAVCGGMAGDRHAVGYLAEVQL